MQHSNIFYMDEYVSNRGNEVLAEQFTPETQDGLFHDVARNAIAAADFEYGKPVLTFFNNDEGVKHVAHHGDYVVFNNGYFTVIDKAVFEHNYHKLPK